MFDAGPHVTCYRALSRPDGQTAGVRCVLYANLIHHPEAPGVAFVWYAEGRDAEGARRHFGEAFMTTTAASSRVLPAQAAAITRNGEIADSFRRLAFQAGETAVNGLPSRLLVSGDLDETWILVPDGVVSDYDPISRRIERTGPQFNEFRVRKRDGTPGFGVRSMLSSGSWIGAGRWREMTHLHLGTYLSPPAGPPRFGAADIAVGNGFCGAVPWGELNLREEEGPNGTLLHVTGTWSETWQQRQVAVGWEAAPEITRLASSVPDPKNTSTAPDDDRSPRP